MIFTILFSFAMASSAPAAPAKADKPVFSFSFGTHKLETVEVSRRSLNGRSAWIGRYLINGNSKSERVLPREIALDLEKKLSGIFTDNKSEITVAGKFPCVGRMIYKKADQTSRYCTDGSSPLAQSRITNWIREAQGILDIKPLK